MRNLGAKTTFKVLFKSYKFLMQFLAFEKPGEDNLNVFTELLDHTPRNIQNLKRLTYFDDQHFSQTTATASPPN